VPEEVNKGQADRKVVQAERLSGMAAKADAIVWTLL